MYSGGLGHAGEAVHAVVAVADRPGRRAARQPRQHPGVQHHIVERQRHEHAGGPARTLGGAQPEAVDRPDGQRGREAVARPALPDFDLAIGLDGQGGERGAAATQPLPRGGRRSIEVTCDPKSVKCRCEDPAALPGLRARPS